MSKLVLSLFVISLFLFLPVVSKSTVIIPIPVITANDHSPKPSTLKTREIEKLIGRKLTVKEKLSLFITRNIRPAASSNLGKTALIIGIVAASLFLIGCFVPYVIIASLPAAIIAVVLGSKAKKQNPEDRKAHTAVLLGWITLGLGAVIIVAALLVTAMFSWQ